MKGLTQQELTSFFQSLEPDFDVRVPVRLHDGTRSLGKLNEGPLALAGGVVPKKITSVFFEHTQLVLSIEDHTVKLPEPVDKPFFVVGFTAEDADCLEFIDRFFGENFRDDIYFSRRTGAIVVCVSGRCGKDGAFLKIAGKNCDLELVCDGEKYLVVARSDAGRKLAERITTGADVPDAALKPLLEESEALPTDDADLIEAASQLILGGKVPDEFWRAISDRCIACTSCNLACPTCTCFDVYDRSGKGERINRWRMWDSCQLDGFMREASGHNPLGTEDLRTRRRIHHKLAADVTRWGHKTCFLCGRCDDVCPSNIGIKAVCREMIEKCG